MGADEAWELDAALRAHPLVQRVGESGRTLLAERSAHFTFRPNRRVLTAGTGVESVALLLRGSVRAHVDRSPDGPLLVELRAAPGTWGDAELLAGTSRAQSVTTLEYSDFLFVPASVFRHLLGTEPELLRHVAARVSASMVALIRRNGVLEGRDLTTRLSALLLDYARVVGEPLAPDALRLRIKLSQEQLAQDVGASRKGVGESMALLRRRGWVGRVAGRWALLAPARLQALVERPGSPEPPLGPERQQEPLRP